MLVDYSFLYAIIALFLLALAAIVDRKYPVNIKPESMPIYHLDTIHDLMPFGKYKGKTVEWVIKNDNPYAEYIVNNMRNVICSTQVQHSVYAWRHLAK
jgi:hypothetical protein